MLLPQATWVATVSLVAVQNIQLRQCLHDLYRLKADGNKRRNSSKGYFGFFIVSIAQSLASLMMPLSGSVFTHWRSTTQSSAGLPLTTYS